MRKVGIIIAMVVFMMAQAPAAFATPSTQIWIPSTDIQAFGVTHLGVDNYNTLGKKQQDGGRMFPTTYGLTIGVVPSELWGIEIGIDMMEASDDPLFFNAKIGISEGALGDWSPSFAIGGYGFGTEQDSTDSNLIYGLVAKTFGAAGRFTIGYYTGNEKLLLDKNGEKDNAGLMASWDKQLNDKFWAAVDYQGGNNSWGALSFGVSYALSDSASIILGYDIFNENDLNNDGIEDNSNTMTFQLDVNF
ncbi:hypothetical protein MNBD_NITROSPINAE02-1936 [hydrothermal vent metagenome]|uniref:Outer membrane protein beta-barrel domain-containing protein n=1 Tax=hydrothermal vent metagenome TaxID=652676 RepID=A0A3B1D2H6_9ZZZZ